MLLVDKAVARERFVGLLFQSKSEWRMAREYCERPAFNRIPEVLNCEVRWRITRGDKCCSSVGGQPLGKENARWSNLVDFLLKDSIYGYV